MYPINNTKISISSGRQIMSAALLIKLNITFIDIMIDNLIIAPLIIIAFICYQFLATSLLINYNVIRHGEIVLDNSFRLICPKSKPNDNNIVIRF